jgi:hypothetical protein
MRRLRGHLLHGRCGSIFDPSDMGSESHQHVLPAGRERGRLARHRR